MKVATTGYAPQVVYYSEEQGIEVQQFLEGYRSCNVGDLLDGTIRSDIVRAYRLIHETQTLSRTKTGFDQLDERLAQVTKAGGRLPRDLEYIRWQCDRARGAVNAAGMNHCACYNDAYVTNFMVDANSNVRIIDWEYASNNDPYWDLAIFSVETFLSDPENIREIIEIHDGTYTRAAEARIVLYIGVAIATWGLWAALQERISSISFDFGKYSELYSDEAAR